MAKIPFKNISKNESSNTNDCIELILENDKSEVTLYHFWVSVD